MGYTFMTENPKTEIPIMMKLRTQFNKFWAHRKLRIMCMPVALLVAVMMVSQAGATSYECTTSDGKTTLSNQPCSAQDSAIEMATKAAAKAVPTKIEELEEYTVEELAFIASLQLHVFDSLDPACQKMKTKKTALETRDYLPENGEKESAELTTLNRTWSATCRRQADAAKDSYPPPGRVSTQSLFGSSPRCMAWAGSVVARSRLGQQPTEEEMASEMSRECRCGGPDSNKVGSRKANSDQLCPGVSMGAIKPKQTSDAGMSASLSEGLKKIKALEKSVKALELTREADYNGLEARRDAELGPKCSSLFKMWYSKKIKAYLPTKYALRSMSTRSWAAT
jgi:hypothetical protein